MSETTSLEDMLSDKELGPAEPEPITTGDDPEPEPKEPADPELKDPADPAEPKEPDDPSEPPSPKASETPKEEETWTKAAVLDERRKRQEAEQRLRELEQKSQKPEETPDWFSDPEKAAQHHSAQIEQRLWQQKVELGQDWMRQQHADYDEMEAKFAEMVQQNPALSAELRKSANPARFAYETAKKAAEYEAMKDVDSYKARIEADVRKEVEEKVRKEHEEKLRKEAEKRAAIDPSLASTSSKGGLTSDDYAGPTPLDEILK